MLTVRAKFKKSFSEFLVRPLKDEKAKPRARGLRVILLNSSSRINFFVTQSTSPSKRRGFSFYAAATAAFVRQRFLQQYFLNFKSRVFFSVFQFGPELQGRVKRKLAITLDRVFESEIAVETAVFNHIKNNPGSSEFEVKRGVRHVCVPAHNMKTAEIFARVRPVLPVNHRQKRRAGIRDR